VYFFILLVCLEGIPECKPIILDPPPHYITAEECKSKLQIAAKFIIKEIEKDNEGQSGTVTGQCILNDKISPA